jgi:taurine dioxygenase
MAYETLRVTKLSPHIGAEIGNIDLREVLSNRQFEEVHNAFLENQVIFFRDQHINFDQHLAFARHFGEPHIHVAFAGEPGHPEIRKIIADEKSTIIAGDHWHTDQSCAPIPPMGSILHMHEVPPTGGGDTMFASMYAAYEALSPRMKTHLEGLTATHEGYREFIRYHNAPHYGPAGKEFPSAVHPVIAKHPETGRRLIYVNRAFTMRINELPEDESDAILKYLIEHVSRPEFSVRFHWRPYSIAFWDNRCAQHFAIWDYQPNKRLGYRIQIEGVSGAIPAT